MVNNACFVCSNQELDALSCTDMKQVWGKEKRKVEMCYSAERAVDYWNFQKKTGLEYKSSTEVDKMNLDVLLKCNKSHPENGCKLTDALIFIYRQTIINHISFFQ